MHRGYQRALWHRRVGVAIVIGAGLATPGLVPEAWCPRGPSLGVTLSAQMELAVMVGSVKDEAGQPLADVTFRIKDLERGREVIIKSDKSGKFYRRGLQAVEYELTVEKEGYQSISDRIKLTAGTDRRFDFTLVKAAPAGAGEFTAGVAAFNKGDTAAAIASFEAAVQKAPTLPELRVNLALAYLQAQRIPDALRHLEEAARLAPDDPRIAFQLGGAYIDAKDMTKAAAAFERGLAKAASPPDALALEARVALGDVYFAQGDAAKAATQYEAVLAARPGAANAKVGMGKVHASRGDLEKALSMFTDVRTSAPGTPEAAQAEAFIKALQNTKPPARP